jgi:carboxyl-terminal processing protease
MGRGALIVYTQGRARARQDYRATADGTCQDIRLAILIDEGSASASEIVAGAIQDNDRGAIVGRRSFGKGLVQEPILFSDNSGLRLTVARYYTPTGRCIQKPYTRNRQAYENEVYERYETGEMFELSGNDSTAADSANAAQQFRTPKGKIVYGGGGIMPDVFVPIDTTGVNAYYISVSQKNLTYRFTLQFTDQHRSELNTIQSLDQLNVFLDKSQPDVLFRRYAAGNGVVTTEAGWNECRHIINTQLRAFIGRNTLLEDNAYYAIISKIDNTLATALKSFHEN